MSPNILEVMSFEMSTRVTSTVVCCILMQILCVVSQKKLQLLGEVPDRPGLHLLCMDTYIHRMWSFFHFLRINFGINNLLQNITWNRLLCDRRTCPPIFMGEVPQKLKLFCETTHNICIKIQQTTVDVTLVDILNDVTSKILGGTLPWMSPLHKLWTI